jgi:hypothetical protein
MCSHYATSWILKGLRFDLPKGQEIIVLSKGSRTPLVPNQSHILLVPADFPHWQSDPGLKLSEV